MTVVAALWILAYLGIGLLISIGWFAQSVNARLSDLTYFPLGVRFLGAALVYFVGMSLQRRRLPYVSARLFHASLTTGTLTYFIPSLFLFQASRIVPVSAIGLMMGCIPLFALFFIFPEGTQRAPLATIGAAGAVALFWVLQSFGSPNGHYLFGCLMVLGAMAVYIFSLWVFKRIFWIHSSPDLNFWALLFTALGFFFFAIVEKEYAGFSNPGPVYWISIAIMGLGSTGLGIYLFANTAYRVGVLGTTVMTAALALFPLLIGLALWSEFPRNPITLAAAGATAIAAIITSITMKPHRWLLHYPHSGERQGERLLCLMDGVLKGADGVEKRIQILDVSIGGLGFRSEKELVEGEDSVLFLPVSYNHSTLQVQCRVVRIKSSGSQEFPWSGGMSFENLNLDRRQSIIEFIAKLSVTEEP